MSAWSFSRSFIQASSGALIRSGLSSYGYLQDQRGFMNSHARQNVFSCSNGGHYLHARCFPFLHDVFVGVQHFLDFVDVDYRRC